MRAGQKRERELEAKPNTGIGRLAAHNPFFFSGKKTTAAMNVFPMNLQLQA